MSSARTLGAAAAVGSAVVVALAIGLVVDAGPAAIVGAAVVGSLAALVVEWLFDRGSGPRSPAPAVAERTEAIPSVLGGSGGPAAPSDRTEPVVAVAPVAAGATEEGGPRVQVDRPVDLDGWRGGSWRRGGQCPACGGWAREVVEDGAWHRFTCARCGHRWRWQPGYAWPATLVRPDVGRDLAPTPRSDTTEDAEGDR